jgi:multidrug efflux pump subunit AcrB
MNAAIAWFARNPVAANLLMFFVVVAGLLIAPRIRQEIFPEIKMGMITIAVPYPGATPEEVADAVCVRIEEEIHDIQGVKRVTSSAREGLGTVAAELDFGADGSEVLDEIRARIDAIETLPEETKKPVIREMESFKNAIAVAISGEVGEWVLRELGEQVRDELSGLPGVSHVELTNVRPYEIAIEVSEHALRRHELRFDDVVGAVRRSSLDLPGGSLETRGGKILLRTDAQARRGADFEELLLITRPDGTRLRVGDVATVIDGFEDTRDAGRFDGRPAVLVQVLRSGDQRVLEIVETVKRYVEDTRDKLPTGVSIDIWRDESVPLESRRDVMLDNGFYGLVLVLIVLALFLRPSLAFWVSMGIPISFLGALAVMPLFDASINVISLVAFIVALGLVVDDAIVVGDAVARAESQGGDPVEAAIRGTRSVAIPVVVAALTTMVMLAPVFMLGGVGQQGRPLGVVVIACLALSLIESLFVLPAHLAHASRATVAPLLRAPIAAWTKLQERISGGLFRFIESVYRPALRRALEYRALTLAAALAAFGLSLGLSTGGWVPLVFLPESEGDYVTAVLTMPEGTSDEVLERHVAHLEASAEVLRAKLDAAGAAPVGSVFRHVYTSLGSQPEKRRQSFWSPLSWNSFDGSHLAEVQIALVRREERSVSSTEIARRWRKQTGDIPDVVELSFPVALYSLADPINVQLDGPDGEVLADASAALKQALAGYPGVRDISDSGRGGKRELLLHVRPEAEALGISAADLARQVRQGFHGEEAQRAQRGRDDVPVVVRYPKAERRSLADLDDIAIRTQAGALVPFWTVAAAEVGRGSAMIQRADRRRTLRVTAGVDASVANANEIVASLAASVLPRILAAHPGVGVKLEGQQREQSEFVDLLARGALLGLVAVYALLAIPLRSYTQPLLVLLAVPFGFVGAVFGHAVMGLDMTMFTMIGLVAVTGVVVNDSLVLLSAVSEARAQGMALPEALETACASRFRPIFLTTITTFLGLTPLLLERSTHAQDLKPMAVTLAFGEIVSTVVILFVVPAVYAVFEDFKRRVGFGIVSSRVSRWPTAKPSEREGLRSN